MEVKHEASRTMDLKGQAIEGRVFEIPGEVPPTLVARQAASASGGAFTANVTLEQWEMIKRDVDEAFKRWNDATLKLIVR